MYSSGIGFLQHFCQRETTRLGFAADDALFLQMLHWQENIFHLKEVYVHNFCTEITLHLDSVMYIFIPRKVFEICQI